MRFGASREAIAIAIAMTMAIAAAGCGGAAPPEPGVQETTQDLKLLRPYLALGDSVPFGFNPVDAQVDPQNIQAFVGYPELIALAPIPTTNAACPGETSGSFLDVSFPDNGCHAWRAGGGAMHVQYASNAESQMQYAASFLSSHPTTATVSLMIGANDLFLVVQGCLAAFNPQDANYAQEVAACEAQQVPVQLAQTAQNIAAIAGAIRATGYRGQLVLVTYYASNYSNPNDPDLIGTVALDQVIVQVAQAFPKLKLSIAKGFSSFGSIAAAFGGDACQAGLLFKLGDGTCDVHPSRFGQSVLAAAVAGAVSAAIINLQATPPQF